jgi:staphylococcal nuclease domain-containing protein 1
VWESYEEPEEEEDAVEVASGVEEFVPVQVCEVTSGQTFFVHAATDTAKLADIEARLAAMRVEVGTAAAPVEPRRGAVVAALFDDGSEGGVQWFRARVDGRVKLEGGGRSDLFNVTYIDYGNKEELPVTRMRPLDKSLVSMPPMARECSLALVEACPLSHEHGREAAIYLSELTLGKNLVAKLHGRDDNNRLLVTLFDDGSSISVNQLLVEEGLAKVQRAKRSKAGRGRRPAFRVSEEDKPAYEALLQAQQAAKRDRVNMWEYGDVEQDSDVE